MAVAAFRSTTKRSCRISSSESDGTSSPDSPSTKRGLMRMKSLPIASSRYLSDSSSRLEYNRSRSLSRHLPSDSESEVDGGYSSSTKGRHGIPEFKRRSEESSNPRNDFHRSSTRYRRLASHQELAQVSRQGVSRFGKRDADRKVSGDQLEMHEVEERTIRAVHAQMKSLERDPPSGDILDVNHIYAVIREEVQRAVAGIRKELEESVEKDRMAACFERSFKSSHLESVNAEAIKLSSGISNPSAAKFLQSKERAQELRWQLEEEERRVVDLANSVDGLHLHKGSVRRCTHDGADKQLYSSLLEEDAHTYFKECVSIVNLETPEAQKDCTDGKPFSYVKAKRQDGDRHDVVPPEVQATIEDFGIVGRECKKVKRRPVNVDGIVMPWLDCDWNADSLFPLLEGKEDDSKLSKEEFCSNGASNTPHTQNRTEVQCSLSIAKALTNQQEQAHKNSQKVQSLKPQAFLKTKEQCPAYLNNAISDSLRELDSYQINGPAIRLHETKAAKMAQTSSATSATSTASFMQFTGKIASPQDNENRFGADNILLQRRRFKSKIAHGGMLLCGGKF
ncbi:hypothetical protein O6H91_09G053700 [Diphasiastrum complanatum]|uniref:Uncharacterized protein n=1 Tax=Diphasiastrum complanatum TaxID=34168 RepID=A0ACC2CPC1_DIPCM|nr:hypothetical protein O6H91_09G053700 [Diphasiastrum complanatum]